MKHLYLFVVILSLSTKLSANDDENIRTLVNKWNDLHNSSKSVDLVDFLDLYAPIVSFYSKNYTDENCYNAKLKLFKNGFSQNIITPITITYYNSGTVKADFAKRTASEKKQKNIFAIYYFKKLKASIKSPAKVIMLQIKSKMSH